MALMDEQRQTLKPTGHWDTLGLLIDGALCQGRGQELVVVNPATEEIAARVRGADDGQVDAAVDAASRAFRRAGWRRTSSRGDRSRALYRLADAYEKHLDALVEAIVTEVGSPVTLARSLQVGAPLTHLRWYAEAAQRDWTESIGPHFDPVASESLVAYRPVGVVAAISAYNYPLVVAMHKLGAALAAGCTVVLMPSPRTPVATMVLAQAIAEADLPPGTVNVVVGPTATARRLTEHSAVDKVAFTGSTEVGTLVMHQAAHGVRDVVLELGGKSPAIVFPDVDLSSVIPDLHRRYCRNAGQGCASPTRLMIHRAKWAEFLEISRAVLSSIPVGDPWDPATIIGPLISAEHRQRVEGFIEEAVSSGAEVAAGGGRPDLARGWYTNPALVVGADNSWPIARQEIFGPVAVAFPYDTLDDALDLANDTDYGLHSYLFTKDLAAALAVSEEIRAGSVSINGGGGFRPDAPMGGFGPSGIGRELGRWGIHEYLEPQHLQWSRPTS